VLGRLASRLKKNQPEQNCPDAEVKNNKYQKSERRPNKNKSFFQHLLAASTYLGLVIDLFVKLSKEQKCRRKLLFAADVRADSKSYKSRD